jgi:carboxymethylenebutenolidase
MTGTLLELRGADGAALRAYLAVPAAGSGPGILLCPQRFRLDDDLRELADRYADEGYTVLAPDLSRHLLGDPTAIGGRDQPEVCRFDAAREDVTAAAAALRVLPQTVGRIGALGFSRGGRLAIHALARGDVDCGVIYDPGKPEDCLVDLGAIRKPVVIQLAEPDGADSSDFPQALRSALLDRSNAFVYHYPNVEPGFALPGNPQYHKPSALIAHQRSIAAFRREMGPHYDFSSLWDRHCACEFVSRDVAATMETMVPEPYVNHIPTMTGGVGYQDLKRFYAHHFIPKTPRDTRLIPISRAVGEGILVDEMLFCFTHDIEIDWMLPGIAPTGRRVEIPLVAIVKFRGDKLYNEHIYWDQASVLVQIGKLDAAGLPIAGIETARKLLDETLPSNGLMARWRESADPAP